MTSASEPARKPPKMACTMSPDFVFENSRAKSAPIALLISGSGINTYDNTVNEMNDAIAQSAYDTPNPKNTGAQNDGFAFSYSSIGIDAFGSSSFWYVRTLVSTDATGDANNVVALIVINTGFSNMVFINLSCSILVV